MTDEQLMFFLAALTYRGFSDGSPGRFHTDLIGRAIDRALKDFAPALGPWELVWGPAIYRAPLSGLDDELMYVVRNGTRYVVAIRGTNPISAFDWTFGDVWTAFQAPWVYDASGAAKISLSTALGLAVLQRLRSPGPPGTIGGPLARTLGRTAGGLIETFGQIAGLVLAPLRQRALGLLQQIAADRAALTVDDTDGHILAIAKTWTSQARTQLFEVVREVSQFTGGRLDTAVLLLLESDSRWKASLGSGNDLLTFLASEVARQASPIDVVVTGHSAGGALSSTVALWLAETQGPGALATERWDPSNHATVHCYSYAGPTAGNAAFAARSDAMLGARCQRFWNTRDLVTHAWVRDDLQKVPKLFEPVVPAIPGLGTLMQLVTTVTEPLGYTQVGRSVPLQGAPEPKAPTFFLQFVHQHMQAYIDMLGLGSTVPVTTFFDPLHLLPH